MDRKDAAIVWYRLKKGGQLPVVSGPTNQGLERAKSALCTTQVVVLIKGRRIPLPLHVDIVEKSRCNHNQLTIVGSVECMGTWQDIEIKGYDPESAGRGRPFLREARQ